MRITALSNNWTHRRGFVAEHGLALAVETDGHRILFDTGQGFALPLNLAAVGLHPRDFEAIVLSHGHYDHGGGLVWLTNNGARSVPLFAHPGVFETRLRRVENGHRDIGLLEPEELRSRLEVEEVTEPREIIPGIWLSGEITERHAEEPPDPKHLIDRRAGPEPDGYRDEIALFAWLGQSEDQGVVIVTGCAHAGVVATVEHVRRLTGDAPVAALIGGFHLGGASDERLAWTVERLRRFDIACLVPLHCTGSRAITAFQQAFGERVVPLGAGDSLEIP